MGVYISRIEIQNFRNFGHLVLDPFPARAVIVGENGAGKSNLLHALRLVLDPTLPDSSRRLRSEDVWEGSPATLAAGVVITVLVELRGYDDDDDAKAVLSSATIAYDPYVARLTYRFSPRSDVSVLNDGDVRLLTVDRSLTPQDYDFVVFGGLEETNDMGRVRRDVTMRVLHALRDAESDLRTWRRNPLRDLLEGLPLDPRNLDATANAMAAAVAQLGTDPNVATLEAHLASRLTAMTGPRLPINPTLGFASAAPDELIRAVRLFVDAGRRHSVADASLGSANVLYLGLLLEALSQQRAQDLFVTTILAVEEPEAHLHVSLQRRLFRYLLRSEPTLLLTTHSPHIAAVAPIHSIVVLRSTATGTIGRTTGAVQLTSQESEDLERYLDVSRAEILFASVIVLVEGLAETYVLPALAQAAGFDLDSYGVVVASVHGTDFAPFVRLLGPSGLDIPRIVITDGDAAGDAVGRREAGLRRAVRLHPDRQQREALAQAINDLPDPADGAYETNRKTLLDRCANIGVFVGSQTLEVDLCELFDEEITAAFAQVSSSQRAKEYVTAGVANELLEVPAAAPRAAMLKRIEVVGKGRYAQRLAAHLEKLDLIDFLDGVEEPQPGVFPDLGAPTYLLRALDHASRLVRGRGLLAPEPSVGHSAN